MDSQGFELATVFAFLLFTSVALLLLLVMGWFLRPKKPGPFKGSTYECAEQPFGSAWFNFNNRFYLIALVFVVFDVELALVIPVAVIYHRLVQQGSGLLALTELFTFLTILLVALFYVWARGDLNWIKTLGTGECREVEVGRKEA